MESQITGVEAGIKVIPSRIGRWLLAGVLFSAYLPMQLLLALPAIAILMVFGGYADLFDPTLTMEAYDEMLASDEFLWLTLVVAAIAAVLTVLAALLWPKAYQMVTRKYHTFGEWLAWRKPRIIPIWLIPLLTVPAMLFIGAGVSLLFGPAEIDVQMDLFSTPALQAASLVVVSTVVPVAEELIFRGALYEALLAHRRKHTPDWPSHILPFTLVTLLFAFVHLFAGFETIGAIIQILLLSTFLTAIRAVSGSVTASITAHLVWNLIAAIGLTLVSYLNF
nr:CPBP family intramembrane metalloprotease [Anaerolineae bacterium]